jgi:hypothetical protein
MNNINEILGAPRIESALSSYDLKSSDILNNHEDTRARFNDIKKEISEPSYIHKMVRVKGGYYPKTYSGILNDKLYIEQICWQPNRARTFNSLLDKSCNDIPNMDWIILNMVNGDYVFVPELREIKKTHPFDVVWRCTIENNPVRETTRLGQFDINKYISVFGASNLRSVPNTIHETPSPWKRTSEEPIIPASYLGKLKILFSNSSDLYDTYIKYIVDPVQKAYSNPDATERYNDVYNARASYDRTLLRSSYSNSRHSRFSAQKDISNDISKDNIYEVIEGKDFIAILTDNGKSLSLWNINQIDVQLCGRYISAPVGCSTYI